MRKSMCVIAFPLMLLFSGPAMAQGSGSTRTAPRSSPMPDRYSQAVPVAPQRPTHAQFAASFWGHLKNTKSSYRQWGSPGKTVRQAEPPQQGGAGGPVGVDGRLSKPHNNVGQTYLNHIANLDLQRLPLKSILVREGYAADGQTLENITVMYRSKGVDPANGDWYWIMYLPDGSLATTPPEQGSRPIAGRVQSCVQCHQQAGGKDYVFLNDRPVPGASPTDPHGLPQGVPQADPHGSGARR